MTIMFWYILCLPHSTPKVAECMAVMELAMRGIKKMEKHIGSPVIQV